MERAFAANLRGKFCSAKKVQRCVEKEDKPAPQGARGKSKRVTVEMTLADMEEIVSRRMHDVGVRRAVEKYSPAEQVALPAAWVASMKTASLTDCCMEYKRAIETQFLEPASCVAICRAETSYIKAGAVRGMHARLFSVGMGWDDKMERVLPFGFIVQQNEERYAKYLDFLKEQQYRDKYIDVVFPGEIYETVGTAFYRPDTPLSSSVRVFAPERGTMITKDVPDGEPVCELAPLVEGRVEHVGALERVGGVVESSGEVEKESSGGVTIGSAGVAFASGHDAVAKHVEAGVSSETDVVVVGANEESGCAKGAREEVARFAEPSGGAALTGVVVEPGGGPVEASRGVQMGSVGHQAAVRMREILLSVIRPARSLKVVEVPTKSTTEEESFVVVDSVAEVVDESESSGSAERPHAVSSKVRSRAYGDKFSDVRDCMSSEAAEVSDDVAYVRARVKGHSITPMNSEARADAMKKQTAVFREGVGGVRDDASVKDHYDDYSGLILEVSEALLDDPPGDYWSSKIAELRGENVVDLSDVDEIEDLTYERAYQGVAVGGWFPTLREWLVRYRHALRCGDRGQDEFDMDDGWLKVDISPTTKAFARLRGFNGAGEMFNVADTATVGLFERMQTFVYDELMVNREDMSTPRFQGVHGLPAWCSGGLRRAALRYRVYRRRLKKGKTDTLYGVLIGYASGTPTLRQWS